MGAYANLEAGISFSDPVAQPVEHLTFNQRVAGSSPARVTKLSLVIVVLFPFVACAQDRTFTADPAASAVSFSLGDVLHAVHGTFHVQSGIIRIGRASPTFSGIVIVAAGSGRTGNQTRDRRMSSDILNAAQFSEISFAPHSYEGIIAPDGESSIQVSGTFTLHGTPHELTVPVQLHIQGTSCQATTRFLVPYVQWGLKDPSAFVLRVAKQVQIDLALAGSLTAR